MAEQASNCWVDLLGPQLMNQEETVDTAQALQGKYVALYFSAHWCGPCRGYTPQLTEQYKKIVNQEKKNWEVVFCSSDSDENSFKNYYKSMPWKALPFSKRDLKEKLSTKYGVRGIPTLVLLNTDGELITTGGRNKVMESASFPWLPLPFNECFTNVTGAAENFDINKGVKALYFSAHWCGPCRNFTPNLKEVYDKVKSTNPDFEIVFVTSDRTQSEFDSYFGEMPWAAIPFSNSRARNSLSEKFKVEGIPSMVVLQDGKLLNPSAVGTIRSAGGDPFNTPAAAEAFPWKMQAVQELSMETADNLNTSPCLILFQDKETEAVQTKNASFLQSSASVALEQFLSGNERKMAFYTHNAEHPRITEVMGKMMSEVESGSVMVIVHFGGNGAYYVADLPKSEADVTKFVADFHAGKLDRKQANPPR